MYENQNIETCGEQTEWKAGPSGYKSVCVESIDIESRDHEPIQFGHSLDSANITS